MSISMLIHIPISREHSPIDVTSQDICEAVGCPHGGQDGQGRLIAATPPIRPTDGRHAALLRLWIELGKQKAATADVSSSLREEKEEEKGEARTEGRKL